MRIAAISLALALALGSMAGASAQSGQYGAGGDPPSRVGRLSDLSGAVSLYPLGAKDWTDASVNYPLSSGDGVWVDNAGRAEIQLGASAIRIGSGTALTFGEVSDSVTQLRVDQGAVEVYIHYLRPDEVYEVDTPAGVVSFTDAGRYRVDVTPDGRRTTVTVRSGSASYELDDGSYPVSVGSSTTLIEGQRRPIAGPPIGVDSWEDWANTRDRRAEAPEAARYVSRDMVGYEDLDQYGDWQASADYGTVWYPRGVQVGWAPYRYGRWESIGPWGWTWMDDAPWGFAPFHYGRWASISGRWGWIPGTTRSRPVYAPALVAFIGGAGWSASASFGGRPSVGWVPLGPQEPYIPSYRASPTYVQRVNVTNVRVNVNVTQVNVNNIHYVNRDVPGAVTAVSRDDFTGSRSIGRTAVAVHPADVARARPSSVPLAGDEKVAPPPRDQAPQNADRGGRNGARPSTPPAAAATPTQPPQWHGRGTQGGNPPTTRPVIQAPQNQPPQAQPPQNQPPPSMPPQNQPPADRGRGRQTPPPNAPPTTVAAPAPAPVSGQPVPTPQPPPDRGRGRGRPLPQNNAPPTNTPPAQPSAPPVMPPQQPPPDRGRGRPVPPPAPATPPPTQPPAPQPPPDRGRGRARPAMPPPVPPAPPVIPTPPPASGRSTPPPTAPPTNPPTKPTPPPPPTGRGRQGRPPDTSHVRPPPPPGGGGQPPTFTDLT